MGFAWAQPPYFVFNSACQLRRTSGDRRLVSEQNQGNGLAAVYLATRCLAYAGYLWPVSVDGAGLFPRTFSSALFESKNAGDASQVARVEALQELGERGDLTGYGAIRYRDAGTKEHRDVFTAAEHGHARSDLAAARNTRSALPMARSPWPPRERVYTRRLRRRHCRGKIR